MNTWTDIDTLETHGWQGEEWVAYIPAGAPGEATSGIEVVMGFGETEKEALSSAKKEAEYAFRADEREGMEFEVAMVVEEND